MGVPVGARKLEPCISNAGVPVVAGEHRAGGRTALVCALLAFLQAVPH